MVKKIIPWFVILAMCLMLTGCALEGEADVAPEPEATPVPPLTHPLYTDRDAFYEYYNQVALSDTLSGLTEKFGEPVKEELDGGTSYTWKFDEEYGFVIAPYDTGKVRAKLAYFSDIRQVKPLALGKNLDQVALLSKDYSYDMVAGLFGSAGLEIMQATTDASVNPGVTRLRIWMDDDDNSVQVLFDEKGMVSSISQGSFK